MAQKKTGSTAKTAPRRAPRKPRTIEPENGAATESRTTSTPDQVAELAYNLWESRGRPMGSPDEDWYLAEKQLNG